jgi:diaminopimelate epimerase
MSVVLDIDKLPLDYGHTCMNRFVVIDLRHSARHPEEAQLIGLGVAMCASPFADDLLLLEPSDHADARLRIFGGDGREGDFCANGLIYTAAKLGEELDRETVKIEMPNGVCRAWRQDSRWIAEVGATSELSPGEQITSRRNSNGLPFIRLLRAGEPHLILGKPDELAGFNIDRIAFEDYCRPLRDLTNVPGGVNITIVFQQDRNSLLIRTFERGVRRHTFSCGTGAVAAIAALFGAPEIGSRFHVCSPGGMHEITYQKGRWYIAARPERMGSGYLLGETVHLPISDLTHYATT